MVRVGPPTRTLSLRARRFTPEEATCFLNILRPCGEEGRARAGRELWVSRTVDLVTGSGLEFVEGSHDLKGVSGEGQLLSLIA